MTTLTIDEREALRAYQREYMRRRNAREREELRAIRAKRATLLRPTPATHAMFWEADDGWHAAYLVWRVGPCADYTAAAMALREAMCVSAWDIAMAVQL